MNRIALTALALAAASCGQTSTTGSEKAAGPDQAAVVVAGDPCTLVPDTAAVFGRDVSAENAPMPNMCTWRSADAVVTGSIIVHGAGWSPVSDAQRAYDDMAGALPQLGATQPVAGLGDQALGTQPGSHVQIVFRKGGVAANVGASSSDPALTSATLADRIARAAADRL